MCDHTEGYKKKSINSILKRIFTNPSGSKRKEKRKQTKSAN